MANNLFGSMQSVLKHQARREAMQDFNFEIMSSLGEVEKGLFFFDVLPLFQRKPEKAEM